MRVLRLGNIKGNTRAGLMDQLEETAPLLASDPRDKVFGLLSICRQTRIVADYSKTIREVFCQATLSMLQDRNLPYAVFQMRPPLDRNPERAAVGTTIPALPTWALDLTIGTRYASHIESLTYKPSTLKPLAVHVPDLLRSIERLPVSLKFNSELNKLSTVAAYLGTIVETSKHLFDTRKSQDTILPTTIYDTYHNVIKPRQIAAKVFLQVLVVGSAYTADDITLFEQFLQEHPEEDDPPTSWNGVYGPIQLSFYRAADKMLFVTAERQVGMAYHPDFDNGIRPGDIVVGLFGINYPFVLRKVPGETGSKPLYTMINTAYIANHIYGHGFVENAPPKAKWRDFKIFGLEEYRII